MKDWKEDKKWSDKYLPEIKRNLGQYLISEPENIKEDKTHNTDLTVLELKAVRIACRIRDDEYRVKYGDEFTVRAGRPSGVKTELTKIMEGWGDYLFYGFADKEKPNLSQWFIGDLKAFRLWLYREMYMNSGAIPGTKQHNWDGSSYFMAFKKDIIPDFIIAKSA